MFLSGVTAVGKNAFSGCAVEEVTFPETLEAIRTNAFRNCEKLTQVDLSATKVRTISSGAFLGCGKLTKETVHLPETVEYVAKDAFDPQVGQAQKGAPQILPEEPEGEKLPVTWTEVKNGEYLQITRYPDGTLSTVCRDEEGNLLYTSTTTFVDGKSHEERDSGEGATMIVERIEDENGGAWESTAIYVDGVLVRTSESTDDGKGNVHDELLFYRETGNELRVEDRQLDEQGNVVYTVVKGYIFDGANEKRLLMTEKTKFDGNTTVIDTYNAYDKLIMNQVLTENSDGTISVTSKRYEYGTYYTTTTETKAQKDAQYNNIWLEKVTTRTNDEGKVTFTEETTQTRNPDGTYQEVGTMQNEGGNRSNWTATLDADEEVIHKKEEYSNGGVTTREIITDVDANGIKTVQETKWTGSTKTFTTATMNSDDVVLKEYCNEYKQADETDEEWELWKTTESTLQDDGTYQKTVKEQGSKQVIITVYEDYEKEIKRTQTLQTWSDDNKLKQEWTQTYDDAGQNITGVTNITYDYEGNSGWTYTEEMDYKYEEGVGNPTEGKGTVVDEKGNTVYTTQVSYGGNESYTMTGTDLNGRTVLEVTQENGGIVTKKTWTYHDDGSYTVTERDGAEETIKYYDKDNKELPAPNSENARGAMRMHLPKNARQIEEDSQEPNQENSQEPNQETPQPPQTGAEAALPPTEGEKENDTP